MALLPVFTFAQAVHDSIRIQTICENTLGQFDAAAIGQLNAAYSLANGLISKADSPAERNKAVRLRGLVNLNLSDALNASKRSSDAIARYRLAEADFRLAADTAGMIEALGGMAGVYRNMGEQSRSTEAYFSALRLAELARLRKQEAVLHNNVAVILSETDTLAAVNHLNKAIGIQKEFGHTNGLSSALNNLGMHYYRLKKYTTALPLFRECYRLRKELKVAPMSLALPLQNIGGIYSRTGMLDSALYYFERALHLRKEAGNRPTIAQSMNSIANLELQRGNIRKAKIMADSALANAVAGNIITFVKDVELTQYRVDSARGDYSGALKHYLHHITLRDSLMNEETRTSGLKSEARYEFSRREAEMEAEQRIRNQQAQDRIQRQQVVRNFLIAGLMLLLLASLVFLFQRNRIGKEKARSEGLLLNILPHEVAEELKEKGEAEAKQIDEVTVLFTDFKGFTQMSEQVTPKELVRDLHECFSAFDNICQRHSIEKIKTIGDAYMAAGGLPTPKSTHAHDVVKAGLEMAAFVAAGKASKQAEGHPFFEIRIGIHTGPVVAGIVGIKKFQYDIWGDTVNTASRMESSGEVGKVNISEATYALVKDDFNCEYRGEIEAKGKGKMGMWFAFLKK